MPHPDAIRTTQKPRWPVVVFVIGSVSAVSVALGLMVVGPMIQRSRETAPTTLAASVAPTATSAPAPAPTAEVDIIERTPPPPPPKPEPLPESSFPSVPESGTAPDSFETPAFPPVGDDVAQSESRSKPAIRSVISDGEEDKEKREGRDRSRRDRESEPPGRAGRTGEEPRPQAIEPPKARTRRTSPIEALPRPLPVSQDPAPTGTAGNGETRTSSRSDQEIHGSERMYKVQIGRFAEESAAQRVRDELAGSGFSANVVRSERGGTVLYRVQVGTFRQKENADRTVEKLKAQSYEPYIADDE